MGESDDSFGGDLNPLEKAMLEIYVNLVISDISLSSQTLKKMARSAKVTLVTTGYSMRAGA